MSPSTNILFASPECISYLFTPLLLGVLWLLRGQTSATQSFTLLTASIQQHPSNHCCKSMTVMGPHSLQTQLELLDGSMKTFHTLLAALTARMGTQMAMAVKC